MVSIWKAFLFFCFAVFFLSGCGKNSSNQAKVTAVPNVADQNANSNKIDLSKLSKADQIKAKLVAKDVKALMKMSKKADEVFNQAWGAYWNDFSLRPSTVFRAVKDALEASYAEDGIELKPLKGAKCPESNLKVLSSNETSAAYSLRSCAAGVAVADISVSQDPQGKTVYQIKYAREPKWMGQLLSTFGSIVFNADEKDPSKAYIPKSKFVLCAMSPDASLGLAEMTCTDSGQDRDLDTYVVFKKMDFVANKEVDGLHVTGYEVRVGDEGPKVFKSFEMADSLKANEIVIKEKEIASQEVETERSVKTPEPPTVSEEEATKNADKAINEAFKATQVSPAAKVKSADAGAKEPQGVVGDQGVDPSQLDAVTGEIVPLQDIETETQTADPSTQGIPAVR